MKSYYHSDNVFFFEGCVSLQTGEKWVSPWRIPYRKRDFFPFLNQRVSNTTPGVRLCFSTDSKKIQVKFLAKEKNSEPTSLDVFINDELFKEVDLTDDNMILELDAPGGMNDFLIYLPTDKPVWVDSVTIDDDADIITTRRPSHPRWLHYGSSISHASCARPTRAWPVQVARKLGLNLRDFGFNGNCQSEPMIGRLLRDLPADYITLKLGINSHGGALSERTFAPNVIGLIQLIREKHHKIPIGIISPIYSPPREVEKGGSGLSLKDMREILEGIVKTCQKYGDDNIYYICGLDIFGKDDIEFLPDELHPDGNAGQDVMAKNFIKHVFGKLNPKL
jgi:GDSL-like lipase/acylhydrolase family protein/salicyl acyltransferaes SsfX3-like protein